MKKLITITSILAAGTLVANADVVVSTALDDTGTWTKPSDKTIGSKSYANISVTVGFNIVELSKYFASTAMETIRPVFTLTMNDHTYSLQTGYSSSDNKAYLKTFGVYYDSNDYTKLSAISDATGTTLETANLLTLFSDTNKTFTGAAATMILNNEGVTVYFTATDSTGTEYNYAGRAEGIKSSATTTLSSVTYNATYAEYLRIDSSVLSETAAVSANKAVIKAIPEPSFFGLFAGTLALGLAGTRRRRRGNSK